VLSEYTPKVGDLRSGARAGSGDPRTTSDVAGWDELWSILAMITVRKCGERRRFARAARRDVILARRKLQ
jgi:hypothetical protein